MSALRLKLTSKPAGRLDLSGLIPSRLAGLSESEIARLEIATGTHGGTRVGDVFAVSGTPGDSIVFEGTTQTCDGLAAALDAGSVVVEGHAGANAARGITGGRLEVRGNAGAFLASGMSGGVCVVDGDAGDYLGGVEPGQKFGMAGGTVLVKGSIGERAGDRMRRGSVVVRGRTGAAAGSRMVGGTIVALGGLGAGPGPLLRRGTLIAPGAERLLATFNDCGRHSLVVLQLLNRHLAQTLGPLAPPPLPGTMRRLAGDMATIGKGEILLFG